VLVFLFQLWEKAEKLPTGIFLWRGKKKLVEGTPARRVAFSGCRL